MQNVQVFHVGQGSPRPTVIRDAEFRTEGEGDLIIHRGPDLVAQFPAGKWSAVVKMDAPTQETR